MKEVTLDAGRLCQKEEAHAYLKERLGLPDYYGANLDALYDCLTELDGLRVIIYNRTDIGCYVSKIIEVMQDADVEVELR
ncbi:barstar family protein [Dorea sp. D27]|uniref:barstar family protein n=1 Tax=Dorea sp. D27 TaxID=658665 RepID=UPI0006731FBA|nr:barstar family protein [Dorea sp. D27]KMZ55581.1 barstar (Ribonuclease inhibitor) [Dorea sp. D27]